MDHRRDTLTDLYTSFLTNLAAAGGVAHRVQTAPKVVSTIREILGEGGPDVIWVSSRLISEQPDIATELKQAGYELRTPDDPADVRDQPVGLTIAQIAIAETGSLLLDEPGIADRSVSLMTELLIVICPLDALVPSLDETTAVLREISNTGPSYATFVTGPSRTADIERQLTIGVQGPAAMHVIFLP